jgi:excisionase family DNA binding protein
VETYTLRQAAQLLGVSLPTLRRRVTRGELPAQMTPGPYGDRWEIEREHVLNLLDSGEALLEPPGEADEAGDEEDEAPQTFHRSPSEAGEPLQTKTPKRSEATNSSDRHRDDPLHGLYEAHEAGNPSREALHLGAVASAHEALQKGQKVPEAGRHTPEPLQTDPLHLNHEDSEPLHNSSEAPWASSSASTSEVISDPNLLRVLDMLQEAQQNAKESLEEARRYERQSIALQYELHSYRRALSENAQTLVEKQTMADQAEHLAERTRELEEQNKIQLEQFETEKIELYDRLKLSERRIDWLERRVPKWVRKVFGAG